MPPKTTTPAAEEAALVPATTTTTLTAVEAIIATIPSADSDPTERMVEFILSQPAEKWDELWAGLPSIRDYKGRVITVRNIRVRPSDFEGGVGVYFILDALDVETGQDKLISCSSQMAMVQLLALYRDKRLPATVEVVEKEKKTARGFLPIHLRYIVNPSGPVVSEQ